MISQAILTWQNFRSDGIFGKLEVGTKVFSVATHAYSKQDPEDANANVYAPMVGAGNYKCERYLSPDHGYYVYLIRGVKDHEGVEFHVGNFPQNDSDGCILIGQHIIFSDLSNDPTLKPNSLITTSRISFQQFMSCLDGLNEFTLSVI